MKYNTDKFRVIGVGERLESGDFYLNEAIDESPRPVSGQAGYVITDSEDFTYLRPIEAFSTGSIRQNKKGKGRFDLIPYEAMYSLAMRFEEGVDAHGPRNWELGQPLSVLVSSMRRHAHQLNYDFREDHAGAVLWNASAFVATVSRIEAGILPKELDDIGWFTNKGVAS